MPMVGMIGMIIIVMILVMVTLSVVAMVIIVMILIMVTLSMVAMVIIVMILIMVTLSMVAMVIIVMILVMVTLSVVAMVIIVMILIPMIIVALFNVNTAVEVFSFTPHQRWAHGGFDREAAVIGKSPFQNNPELAINRVVLRAAIQIVLKSSMAFNRDDRSGAEFTSRQFFTTSSMTTMGLCTANGSIASHQQSKG
ncbi:Hypothetical protein with transmembranes domains [Synechococcus sp. WH 7803]|nr:Hypothetical protein with transmembranes domains [Synechococcus sp. WH 7803]